MIKTLNVNSPKVFEWTVMGLVMIVSCIFAISCIKEGHDWGGDFSLYIAQSQAFLNGTIDVLYGENKFTVLNSSKFSGPYLYPFGFPVLLSAVYYFVGLDFVLLKLFCTFFFIPSLPLVYMLAKQGMPRSFLGLLPVAGIAFHPVFLQFSDGVQADFPYLFFSLIALLFLDKARNLLDQALIGVVIFLSFWIRDIGVLLLPTLFALQVQRYGRHWKRLSAHQWLSLACPYFVFAMLFAANYFGLPHGGENHLYEIMNRNSWENSFHNFDYYLSKGLNYLYLGRNWPSLLAIALLTGIEMVATAKKHFFLVAYFGLVCVVLVVWPFLQNFRYLMPIIPLYVYFVVRGIVALSITFQLEKWCYIGLILAASLHAFTGLTHTLNYFDQDSNQALTPEMKSIYQYVSLNLENEDVIGFHKPRVLRLFTGKRTIDTDLEHFPLSKANYLLKEKPIPIGWHYPVVFAWENYALLKNE